MRSDFESVTVSQKKDNILNYKQRSKNKKGFDFEEGYKKMNKQELRQRKNVSKMKR